MHRRNVIIFDIDGTLSDCAHRQHFLAGKQKDWKSFFEHAEHDRPIGEIAELLNTLHASRKFRIILCTGRGEEMRELTEAWLEKNQIPYESLMMRPEKDLRQDATVKKEMLDVIGADKVLFAVDDRQQAVDMWRRNGVLCLQCAEGNF